MLSPGDIFIIDAIKRRDKKAFEYLFKYYYQDLCRYARKLVRNDSVAEDLVMDVFSRIWESESKLNLNTSVSGYLFQSVHNQCINHITRTQKRFPGLDNETKDKLFSLLEEKGPDPLDSINFTELNLRIERSIDLLPEECRKIFIMSRREEMAHKEIAINLGISENTVKVQIYRALKKLRTLLKEFLKENKNLSE